MKLKAKILTIVLVLATLVSIFAVTAIPASAANITSGTTLYLNADFWDPTSARFAAYFYNSSSNKWVSMSDSDGDGIYEVTAPSGTWTNVIFCRMNPAYTTNSWNTSSRQYVYNQTGDLTYDGTKNLFKISQWDGQASGWSSYTPPTVYLKGTFDTWGSGKALTKSGNNYTTTFNLSANTYEIKVNSGDKWWGAEEEISTTSNLTLSDDASVANVTLKVSTCGAYTFTFSSGKLTVTRADNDSAHTGGTATCTAKAVCTDCGTAYGSVDEDNHTGTESVANGTEAVHSTYSCCGATYSTTHDDFGDYTYVDGTNHSRTCACGYVETTAHTGGTATCTSQAVCDDCKTAYGNLADHTWSNEWSHDADGHWKACTVSDCSAISSDGAATGLGNKAEHSWSGSSCSICTEAKPVCDHSYSTTYVWADDYSSCTATKSCTKECGLTPTTETTTDITCVDTATCTAGGTKTYTATFTQASGIDSDTKEVASTALGHSFGATTTANDATCLAAGNSAYKYCSQCELYYADTADDNESTANGKADTSSFVINQLDHSYTGAIKSDGNGENATHSFKCVNGCEQYGNPESHAWSEAVRTKNPTCVEKGVDTYTCTVNGCGATYTKDVDLVAHSYDAYGDCTVDGCEENNVYVLVGETICGTWDDDENNYLLYDAETKTHSITINNLAAGEYEFKVKKPGNWDNAFGENGVAGANDNYVLSIPTDGCWVTITIASGKLSVVTYAEPLESDKVYYLVPGVWDTADAWYAIYYYNISTSDYGWAKMTKVEDHNYYSATVTRGYTHFIFVRFNPEYDTTEWNSATVTNRVWNQSVNLSAIAEGDTYYVSDWDEADWHTHSYNQQVVTDAYKATDATCTAAATYYYSCSCGDKGTGTFDNGNPNGHSYTVTYNWTETDGVYSCVATKTCACKNSVTVTGTVTHETTTAPKCESAGVETYTAMFEDTDCETQTKEVAIDMLGHDYTGNIKDNGDGTHSFKCKNNCGDYGNATSHNYDQTVSTEAYKAAAPTCTTPTTYYYSCSCGAAGTSTYTYGDRADHLLVEQAAKTATCLSAGNAVHYTCKNCTNYFTTYDPKATGVAFDVFKTYKDYYFAKLEHDYTGEVKADDNGTTHSFKCKNGCEQYGNSTAHTYDQKVATDTYKATDATCTAKATYYYSCSCGASSKGTDSASTFANGEKDSTNHSGSQVNGGTEAVHSKWSCCDVVISDTHALGDTWTSDGDTNHKKSCDCGYTVTEAHVYDNNCDVDCNSCTYTRTITHTYEQKVATDAYKATDATCTAKATYYYSCSCGASSKGTENQKTFESGDKLAHVFVEHEAVEATCEQAGNKTYYTCNTCKLYFGTKEAGGNSWENFVDSGYIIAQKSHAYTGKYHNNGDGTHSQLCVNGCNQYGGAAEHLDSETDKDHACDTCGAIVENCSDKGNDGNHSCDVCGKENVSEHDWAGNTCTAPQTCNECGTTSGAPLGHLFTTKETCDRNCGAYAAAKVGENYYGTLAEAAAVAQSGDIIVIVSDTTLSAEVLIPTGVTFDGNGKTIDGTILPCGEITFTGITKVTHLNITDSNVVVNIGEGASLQLTGTSRIVIGHEGIFNIKGSIDNAKEMEDLSSIVPSLVVPGGASITGAGVKFNVSDAYISMGSTSSKNSSANGTFILNFTNSIVEFTNQFTLSEPTNSKAPTFNVNIKDCVVSVATKLCIAAPDSTVDIDNSTVAVKTNIRNSGKLNLKNGSVLSGNTIQFGENGGNNGIITVDNSALTIAASSEGHALDGKNVGSIILKNGATAKIDYITDSTVSIDGTSTLTSTKLLNNTVVNIDAANFAMGDDIKVLDLGAESGTVNVTNLPACVVDIRDSGDVSLGVRVAKIGEVYYKTLQDAVNAGGEVELLGDLTLTETVNIANTVSINTGEYTLTSKANVVFNITAGGVTFKLSGKLTVSDPDMATYARSGSASVSQTVLTMDDVNNVKAILAAKFVLGDGDVIYSGDVDNISLSVKAEYATILNNKGYVTQESATEGMVDVVAKSLYYIGEDGYWYFNDVNTGIYSKGADGESIKIVGEPESSFDAETNSTKYTIKFSDGSSVNFTVFHGADGAPGADGNGIESIVTTDEIVDDKVVAKIITINYTKEDANGNTSVTFKIPCGIDGASVTVEGIVVKESNETSTTYTIKFNDDQSVDFTVMHGKDGADGSEGNGIEGILVEDVKDDEDKVIGQNVTVYYTKTDAEGNESVTFFVPNGSDGHTPVISIDENGEWCIDGESTGVTAVGKDGKGIKTITKTSDGLVDTYTIIYTDDTEFKFTVTNGRGIVSIILTSTSSDGLVDTYTITYNDGSYTTFTVTNGANGVQGIQGVPGKDGHTPIITIQNGKWHVDGTDTGMQAQGVKGETGNGISDISKTAVNGLVDTYTITYTDGTTTTFTVTNGAQGEQGSQGIQGIQGVPGKDGHTPVITIQNGNWFIDGVDTGVKAEAVKGEDGADGEDGEDGKTPYIGENGNWWIDGVDTGVKAEGKDGNDNNKIIIICIGIAALCIIVTIVAVSTKKFRRPWWILC